MRYELTGSGCTGTPEVLELHKHALIEAGAKNVRQAYAFGWNNQPKTLRFSAPDDETARKIGTAVDIKMSLHGLGLVRACGTHWQNYRS